MKKRTVINIRIDPDLKNVLDQVSAAQHRTSSQTTRMLIEEYCTNPARLKSLKITLPKKFKMKSTYLKP